MSRQFVLQADYEPAGDQGTAISALRDGIENGLAQQVLLGVTGSGKTFTVANLVHSLQRPAIILAPNKTLAAQLYGEMKGYFPDNAVEYFVSYYDYYQPEAYVPASDTYIEKDASINDHIEQMRLSATKAILERSDTIIVASVSAIYGLGDPDSYLRMVLHLDRGDEVDQRTLLRRLAELQYKRNDDVLQRATYRVHGDVIDIFPAESAREAVRVQLFDDVIESLSHFDPLTGKTVRQLPRITIHPKSHYVTDRQVLLDMVTAVREELRERLKVFKKENKLLEAQRIEQRTAFDMEMILELGYCTGIENYSRYLSGRAAGQPPPTLMDYLPDNALLFVDESHVTIPQLGGMYRGDRSRKETLVNYGFRLPSALDNRPLRFDEFMALAPQMVCVSATPGPWELQQTAEPVEQIVRPTGLLDPEVLVRPVTGQVDELLSEIHQRAKAGERVLVTTLTKRMAEDLTEYLNENGARARYLHADIDTVERMEIIHDLRIGAFDALIGINLLREGLDIPEVSLVAVLDADKEGFLRSGTSLVQTIGRAARHIHGKAILFADTITGSMRHALDETQRRRDRQEAHNQQHGITPKGIRKAVADILEAGLSARPQQARESQADYEALRAMPSGKPLGKHIKELEARMRQHARELEFEEAARLRDTIADLMRQGAGSA